MSSSFNIFMNAYQQPENKLTYNFFSLLTHMSEKTEFIEFLISDIDKKTYKIKSLIEINGVMGGGKLSNPDGNIIVQTDNNNKINIYFENKTSRLKLTKEQISNHVKEYCKDNSSLVLVITPRESDKLVINQLESDINIYRKIVFKTWEEVRKQLLLFHNNDFITSQFLNYGNTSNEFKDMVPTKQDINTFKSFYVDNPQDKIKETLNSVIEEIDFDKYDETIIIPEITNKWGRYGYEVNFTNQYNLWFFIGIYYNDINHNIDLENGEPNISFFLDIKDPGKSKEELSKKNNIDTIIGKLKESGFEDNLLEETQSKWRVVYKNTPVSHFPNLSADTLTKHFEKILEQIFTKDDLSIVL